MTLPHLNNSPQASHGVPAEFEPGAPPVEPDKGPISPLVSDGPADDPFEPGANGSAEPLRQMAENPRIKGPLGRQQAASARDTKAPLSAPGLALPHERDESPDAPPATPDPVMLQAKRDIDAGLVDTDMRATPGQDAALRERLVPGPGGKPLPSGS